MYNGAQIPNINDPPTGKWTTGLFDCCEDYENCCFTCWCRHLTFGWNVEIIDQGRTSATKARSKFCVYGSFGLGSIYSYKFRSGLRALYNLPEEPCNDCCVHCWCSLCAICQEYRELKNRGLDPSKGWKANEGKMKTNLVPPQVEMDMSR
ncbi:protein PLANT CADMIUM RESISTANCE 7-like [Trifolium pratense]|uniref:protein PLANT CADMIUM RESISTANCE 7-like n=1 Tax=Trifolium pratense TaxID=57577 RepID=UPI001E696B16|nr:protein PLANT CADMIUM RESISTANCE 7-like [Trifolium pratense]